MAGSKWLGQDDLFDFRKRADLGFESLIVLALDLEFCLELLDLQIEARDFHAKFLDVRGGRLTRWCLAARI